MTTFIRKLLGKPYKVKDGTNCDQPIWKRFFNWFRKD